MIHIDIYEAISAVGTDEIADILDHVLFCYTQLYPDWSVSVISIDKKGDKNQQLNDMIRLLEGMKEK